MLFRAEDVYSRNSITKWVLRNESFQSIQLDENSTRADLEENITTEVQDNIKLHMLF